MKTSEDKASGTCFSIYQIQPDRDVNSALFLNTENLNRMFGSLRIDSESYDRIYTGNMVVRNLEDIYTVFNVQHPADFRGRSLSVSDVVEILDSPSIESGFYFCDRAGFTRIPFAKQLTQDSPYYNDSEVTMEIYNVSFRKNDVFQARLVKARSIEQAEAYFRHIEPRAEFIGIGVNQEGYKPGKPMEIVPEDWVAPEMISAVIVEPGKPACAAEIENRLDVLQALVGGYIEIVPDFFFQDTAAAAIVNEEGKLEGLPFNRTLYDVQGQHGEDIAGPMVIVGSDGETFCSLTPAQVDTYLEKYRSPEKPRTLRERRNQARAALDQLPDKKLPGHSNRGKER